jgi:hypothetical protein
MGRIMSNIWKVIKIHGSKPKKKFYTILNPHDIFRIFDKTTL